MDAMAFDARTTQPELPAQAPVGMDFEAVKTRQQATWASGDFGQHRRDASRSSASRCARRSTCARASACSTSRPETATPRSRRRAASPDVTSTDYVPALLEQGRRRAEADRLADGASRRPTPRQLPFPDASFDVVLSTFGVMFAPNQERAASELLRVVKPGGRIGLASWTPDGLHRPAVRGW